MSKRVLVVGGVAGGASTAARVRRLDESAEVVMFERGPHVSFSNCALPFHLSGIVENSDNLVLMSPEQFKKQYNIEAHVNSEVVDVDATKQEVTIKNTLTGELSTDHYDELMLAPGASPIVPQSIEGINQQHVFTVRNVVDIKKIAAFVEDNNVKNIAVIGAGFIGLEVAENFRLADKNVTIIEAANQVMAPFDYDMAQILHKEIHDHGVELILEDALKTVGTDKVILNSGKEVTAEVVIMAIGVRPENGLAKKIGVELNERGAIKVDHNYHTNLPHVYAVGDAIEVTHMLTKKRTQLTMAFPAQMQARAAADDMYGRTNHNPGVIGSSVVQCFNLNAACTGMNEKELQAEGIAYDIAYVIPKDKVGLMPDAKPIYFKLIYATPSGKIMGAQAIGLGNADKRINVIATAITLGGTLEDLASLELAYSPMYATPKDAVNFAALVGLNVLNGEFKQVPMTQVRGLVESGAFIIDAREHPEFQEDRKSVV